MEEEKTMKKQIQEKLSKCGYDEKTSEKIRQVYSDK